MMLSVQLNPVSLAVIRTLAGLSQSGLSRRTKELFGESRGISQGHISAIESGDKIPPPETLKMLADTLGVPLASLITDPTPDQLRDAMERLNKRVPATKATRVAS